MKSKKNDTNELIYKAEITDVEDKQGEGGGGMNWEIGIDIYALLYLFKIGN